MRSLRASLERGADAGRPSLRDARPRPRAGGLVSRRPARRDREPALPAREPIARGRRSRLRDRRADHAAVRARPQRSRRRSPAVLRRSLRSSTGRGARSPHAVPDEWRINALRTATALSGCSATACAMAGAGIRGRPARAAGGARAPAPRSRLSALAEKDVASADPRRYAAGSGLLDLLIARGHWCSTDRRVLAWMAQHALAQALAVLEQRARAAAPGGWPEVQERLAAAHPTVGGYLDAFQRPWDDCRTRAARRVLVSWPRSDSLRADSGADARRGTVPLLPLLPVTRAIRPAAGSRLRGHSDRRQHGAQTSSSNGCAPPTAA